MEKAGFLTNLSIAVGFLGVVALLLEWAAFLGFLKAPAGFWFNNAIILMLIAIWLKLGAIYHKGSSV